MRDCFIYAIYYYFICYLSFIYCLLYFVEFIGRLGLVYFNSNSLFKENSEDIFIIKFFRKAYEYFSRVKLFKRKKKIVQINEGKVKKNQNTIENNVSETNYISEELLKLHELKERGILTDEEFISKRLLLTN